MLSARINTRVTTRAVRRCLASSTTGGGDPSKQVGKIIRRPPLRQAGADDGMMSSGSAEAEMAIVSNETRLKNAAMASVLLAFCCGVTYYSMNAVGQAGTSGAKDDPLAALREEAQAARDKQDRENQSTTDATEMLKQFQAGEYDPDKYENDGEDEKTSASKRPWWKIW